MNKKRPKESIAQPLAPFFRARCRGSNPHVNFGGPDGGTGENGDLSTSLPSKIRYGHLARRASVVLIRWKIYGAGVESSVGGCRHAQHEKILYLFKSKRGRLFQTSADIELGLPSSVVMLGKLPRTFLRTGCITNGKIREKSLGAPGCFLFFFYPPNSSLHPPFHSVLLESIWPPPFESVPPLCGLLSQSPSSPPL